MSDEQDPAEAPPAVVGVPSETPDAVRPSATGLVVDPAAEEDEAAIEAGEHVVGQVGDRGPQVDGSNP